MNYADDILVWCGWGRVNNSTIKKVEKNAFGEYIITIVRPEDTSVEFQYSYEDFISMYNCITLF